MLGESEHTYVNGCVALVLTNEFTVLSILFDLDKLVICLLLNPLLLFLLYLTDQYFPDIPLALWFTLTFILDFIGMMIWFVICDRFVCTIASGLDLT